MEAPREWPALAGGIHSRGRRNGSHRSDRGLGAARIMQADGGMEKWKRGSFRFERERERFAAPDSAEGIHPKTGADADRDGSLPARAENRNHGERYSRASRKHSARFQSAEGARHSHSSR